MFVSTQTLHGRAILPYLDDLAALRIEIFREYPYLYAGNLAYEKQYLATYAASSSCAMVLACAGERVVGLSTAVCLTEETPECQAPFVRAGMELGKIFYFGESVLRQGFRGQGVYRQFFQGREAAARSHGCALATFCAIERPYDHPMRPPSYHELDPIWNYFGYQKREDLEAFYEYQEIGEREATPKLMKFWLKNLS